MKLKLLVFGLNLSLYGIQKDDIQFLAKIWARAWCDIIAGLNCQVQQKSKEFCQIFVQSDSESVVQTLQNKILSDDDQLALFLLCAYGDFFVKELLLNAPDIQREDIINFISECQVCMSHAAAHNTENVCRTSKKYIAESLTGAIADTVPTFKQRLEEAKKSMLCESQFIAYMLKNS